MKLKKFKLLLVPLLCLFFAQAYSQGAKISGTILDDQGQPLPGANVFQKGTTNGTQTDFDGNFSLTISDLNATLTISFIGFTTQEIPVNGQTNFTISLVASAAALDEVVVVGYGGKNGQIDHLFSEQIDHQFRSKLTTKKTTIFFMLLDHKFVKKNTNYGK